MAHKRARHRANGAIPCDGCDLPCRNVARVLPGREYLVRSFWRGDGHSTRCCHRRSDCGSKDRWSIRPLEPFRSLTVRDPAKRWVRSTINRLHYENVSGRVPECRFRHQVKGRSRDSEGGLVWAQASKEIDIGIQAGFERRSGEWVLDPKVVQAAAELGVHVRFTVYSPLPIIDEGRQRKMSRRRKR